MAIIKCKEIRILDKDFMIIQIMLKMYLKTTIFLEYLLTNLMKSMIFTKKKKIPKQLKLMQAKRLNQDKMK